jgi:hypothetical protein
MWSSRGTFLLFLCVLCHLFDLGRGLFFLVGQERKCFTIEQPKGTPLVLSYGVMDPGHEVEFSLHYGISGSADLLILSKSIASDKAHTDYTTDNDGHHSACFLQKKSDSARKTRFTLSIVYGYDTDYYNKLAEKEHFDAVNIEVHQLNDQMNLILHETDYQKHKEVAFHEDTERMQSSTLWWPMLQLGILVMTGVLQVHHLKHFFKQNKLI